MALVEALVILGLAAPLPAATAPVPSDEVREALARLGSTDAVVARDARELVAGDPAAAAAALEGFSARPLLERRERARLIAAALPAERLADALGGFDDPDPRVRAALVPLLARPDLPGSSTERSVDAEARVERLAALAADDPDSRVRAAARQALGDLDRLDAAAVLAELARSGPPGERVEAARALPPTLRAADAVRALVHDGLRADSAGSSVPPAVLAAALEQHGRLLAEGRPRASDRADLLVALRHPDPRVRRGAARGFDALLARMAEFSEPDEALGLLDDMARAGLERRVADYNLARLALFPACDAERALGAAQRIRGGRLADAALASGAWSAGPDGDRIWRYRARQLETAALLALGRAEEAAEANAAAAAGLDAILGRRQDLGDASARRRHAEALVARGLVEVSGVLIELARGASPATHGLVARAREAHALQLEAQALLAELDGQALGGWDSLLDDELSPYRLLFHGRAFDALPLSRLLEWQGALGRILATVAPREVPGFEPLPAPGFESGAGAGLGWPEGWTQPLDDPRRAELFDRVQSGRIEGARRELAVAEERLARERDRGSLVLPEELIEEVDDADFRVRLALRDGQDLEGAAVLELRVPASLALWYARDLASDGRAQDARIVAGRMRQDLERTGISRWWFYLGSERIVRALMQIGAAFTDEGDAVRAEAALLEAVERLEDVERQLAERGATDAGLEPFRRMRASALVSLAVNANVRMGRPEKALEYYEEAYALRQDEFMTALLACYRARSGRDAEARTLLRQVRPGPQTWYNLACARAMLGDAQEALDMLERELEDNHPSEGSRRRQREWARGDPDLESLRGDPRFEELTRPR